MGPDATPGAPAMHQRRLLCVLTVLSCPYAALKVAWISGSTVGGVTPEMQEPTYVVANIVTLLLELAMVVLAVLFASVWGQCVPAWLILAPTWVGAGLLAPIALGVPLGVAVQATVGGSPTSGRGARTAPPSWNAAKSSSLAICGQFILRVEVALGSEVTNSEGEDVCW
jgi:hypothetical protein